VRNIGEVPHASPAVDGLGHLRRNAPPAVPVRPPSLRFLSRGPETARGTQPEEAPVKTTATIEGSGAAGDELAVVKDVGRPA